MIPPEELKSGIIAEAATLGFDLCGIAPAAKPDRAAYVRRWIDQGRHGEMAWLATGLDRRLDPSLVLPGARSLVMVGLNYHHPGLPLPARIAAYARGADYHRLMEPRLKSLARWLEGRSGARTRAWVDTGPLIERDAAARAGVGWIGKSTMLVSPDIGTWFFLGAILTDADLPPDVPMPDHCGRCTRCIDACPTAAIVAPYQLDARRCIAYLTIEHRGPIPVPLRPAIGDRIFGCDACLEACPWNRFARASRETALAPRSLPPLRELLRLQQADFDSLFRRSPIRRAKWQGFLRNVCVALGNSGSARDIPALQLAAQSAPPLVAEHAEWALQRLQARSQTPPIRPT